MFYFEKLDMASEHNKGLIRNVRLVDSEGAEFLDTKPGYFARIVGLADDDLLTAAFTRTLGVLTPKKNYSSYDATVVGDPLVDKVVICDPAVVATAVGANGLVYRIGNETYGNSLEAGRFGRARVPELDDLFELGGENFEANPIVNQYAVLTAGSFKLTPAATIPVSGLAVEIVEEKYETTGAELMGTPVYICRVVQL